MLRKFRAKPVEIAAWQFHDDQRGYDFLHFLNEFQWDHNWAGGHWHNGKVYLLGTTGNPTVFADGDWAILRDNGTRVESMSDADFNERYEAIGESEE